jgi:hypothetical protein
MKSFIEVLHLLAYLADRLRLGCGPETGVTTLRTRGSLPPPSPTFPRTPGQSGAGNLRLPNHATAAPPWISARRSTLIPEKHEKHPGRRCAFGARP